MKITVLLFILLGLALIVVSACFSKKKKKHSIIDPVPTAIFPYRVNAPSREIELPKKLREVSDLSFDAAANSLWAIADEKGKFYKIHLPNGNPIDTFSFGEDGDYEGLEKLGETFFVMESNGRISKIEQATSEKPLVTVFENALLAKDDCEAFMYDPMLKKLVIGVKMPASGSAERPFYAFDLEKNQLESEPIFTLLISDIQAFLRENGLVGEPFDRLLKEDAVSPGPSAMAVHPATGNYYILASVGKLLLVTKPDGDILQVLALDKKLHTQPEGIAFGTDGSMFISNEAGGKVAKIYVYVTAL
jgi:hypothetical protein